MKTLILSIALAFVLCSATAQDSNQRIVAGMTFADVAAILGQPVNHEVSNDGGPDWWCYRADNLRSVSNTGVTTYTPYSYVVAFDSNGRVSMVTQFNQSAR